ncbi:TetR family transcriptional regulator [Sinomonas cellulolyticus]|uniref:TetR family transcriptional regulator n=1 Tax=Sinomonas cellulolyticus TaxID=2801916 RepID=A0ABS1JXZ9_9MICC|nr:MULTISPECIES: TetR/AcrR family transcriptional regulator [Sinomonas]MBL0704266.1 TetR family transcriptional regulator [Sinomonas cellulolyticus]GHG58631.1 TetR family transcriptional regulator [Sinomonas sp. KCTC 49339]
MTDAAEQDAARRLAVAATAVRLYAEHGYEATSADQIAAAAGLSRSTFFRQFRSKEDVVFADHDTLLEQAQAFLAEPHDDPWEAVCRAAGLVFGHFASLGELAHLRYQVVNRVPSLRDKELVTTFRYERLFQRYLRQAVPGLPALDAVRFASTVIATHNYCLRGLMRGEDGFDAARLTAELDAVRRLYGVGPGPRAGAADRRDDLVVAVFPRSADPAGVAQKVREALEGRP